MKTPRNISAKDLIKKLEHLNYQITRQVGSHIRLTTTLNGTHHITIPNHSPIKIGTLSSIINDIATHNKISKQELIEIIF